MTCYDLIHEHVIPFFRAVMQHKFTAFMQVICYLQVTSVDAGAFFSVTWAVAQSLAVLETHSVISPIHICLLLT